MIEKYEGYLVIGVTIRVFLETKLKEAQYLSAEVREKILIEFLKVQNTDVGSEAAQHSNDGNSCLNSTVDMDMSEASVRSSPNRQ